MSEMTMNETQRRVALEQMLNGFGRNQYVGNSRYQNLPLWELEVKPVSSETLRNETELTRWLRVSASCMPSTTAAAATSKLLELWVQDKLPAIVYQGFQPNVGELQRRACGPGSDLAMVTLTDAELKVWHSVPPEGRNIVSNAGSPAFSGLRSDRLLPGRSELVTNVTSKGYGVLLKVRGTSDVVQEYARMLVPVVSKHPQRHSYQIGVPVDSHMTAYNEMTVWTPGRMSSEVREFLKEE